MNTVANFCIKKVSTILMIKSRNSCAALPWEGWKHAISEFIRAVSLKILIMNSRRATLHWTLICRTVSNHNYHTLLYEHSAC